MVDVSARELIDLMKKLNQDMETDQVLIIEYARALHMWVNSLEHLGSAIAVAFKDTKEKANNMASNRRVFTEELRLITENSEQANYLIPFTNEEKKFGL